MVFQKEKGKKERQQPIASQRRVGRQDDKGAKEKDGVTQRMSSRRAADWLRSGLMGNCSWDFYACMQCMYTIPASSVNAQQASGLTCNFFRWIIN